MARAMTHGARRIHNCFHRLLHVVDLLSTPPSHVLQQGQASRESQVTAQTGGSLAAQARRCCMSMYAPGYGMRAILSIPPGEALAAHSSKAALNSPHAAAGQLLVVCIYKYLQLGQSTVSVCAHEFQIRVSTWLSAYLFAALLTVLAETDTQVAFGSPDDASAMARRCALSTALPKVEKLSKWWQRQ